MGAELWDTNPVFADHMTACEHALAPWVDWSLSEVIHSTDPAALARVHVAPPGGQRAAAKTPGPPPGVSPPRGRALRSQAIATHLSHHGGMLSVAASQE